MAAEQWNSLRANLRIDTSGGWASLHYQSVSLQPRKTQQTRFCTCSPFTHAMGCRAIGAMI
ncbi:hypothetical protein CDEST_03573 [Colletotrichum destructivum]|uniref:SWIM-type domain-containing protein n=1 Tax=Colletotrichum destructivum TaxID=34406 RepID=A0AAX4I5C5_9PEZI|nr:hypothetical protein CDEST_03573 [Colletotrichum destructivum]